MTNPYIFTNLLEAKEKVSKHIDIINLETIHHQTKNQRNLALEIISNVVTEPTIDIFAKCLHSCTTGNYLIGSTCPECGTRVLEEDPLYRPNIWYTVDMEDDFTFMHPYFYISLDLFFRKEHSIDILRFIMNRVMSASSIKYTMIEQAYKDVQSKTLDRTNLSEKDIFIALSKTERSVSFFKDNWELILLEISKSKLINGKRLLRLISYLKSVPTSTLHSKTLALPPRRLLAVERAKSFKTATKAVSTSITRRVQRLVDILLCREMSRKSNYIELDYFNIEMASLWASLAIGKKGVVSSKEGIVRHNINSTSEAMGFRTVITALNGIDTADYDVVHIPYSMAVAIFKYYIMNQLWLKGNKPIYSYRNRLAKAIRNFDQEVYDILLELIEKAKKHNSRGIEIMMQRNPSQGQQGMQQVFATFIKPDPRITSTSCSNLSMEGTNGDIDGDELNYSISLYTSDDLSSIHVTNDAIGLTTTPTDVTTAIGLDPLFGANIALQIIKEGEQDK